MQNVDSYGRREAPIRKRFRLDMDVGGSDSDSSCEKDGLAPAYASRREFAEDYRQIASGMEASTGTPFGSSGRYLDDGIWRESCAKPPLVTPDHVGARIGWLEARGVLCACHLTNRSRRRQQAPIRHTAR